jgi:hypothetical protein
MPSAGEVIRASDVAVQACRVTRTAVQSVSDNSLTVVAFDDERFDTDTMHDTVTNNSRITINTAGIYVVGFNGRFPAGSDYARAFAVLRLNGTTEISRSSSAVASTNTPQMNVTTVHQFDATDYIEVQVFQDNTANTARDLEQVADLSPEFYAARIGAGAA